MTSNWPFPTCILFYFLNTYIKVWIRPIHSPNSTPPSEIPTPSSKPWLHECNLSPCSGALIHSQIITLSIKSPAVLVYYPLVTIAHSRPLFHGKRGPCFFLMQRAEKNRSLLMIERNWPDIQRPRKENHKASRPWSMSCVMKRTRG